MKITKEYLRNIIMEELKVSNENVTVSPEYGGRGTQDYFKRQQERPTVKKFREISDPVEKIQYLKELIDDALGDKDKRPEAKKNAAGFLLDSLNLSNNIK